MKKQEQLKVEQLIKQQEELQSNLNKKEQDLKAVSEQQLQSLKEQELKEQMLKETKVDKSEMEKLQAQLE